LGCRASRCLSASDLETYRMVCR